MADAPQQRDSVNRPNAQPRTLVVSWRAEPSCAARVDAALAAMTKVASTFAGHIGVDVFRLDGQDHIERRIVAKFASRTDLRRWERSPDRQHCYRRMRDAGAEPVQLRRLTGLEAWFELPASGDRPPKRWRVALLTWAAAFVIAAVLYAVAGPFLAAQPLLLRALIVTGVLVGILSYVAMPLLTRMLRRWLV